MLPSGGRFVGDWSHVDWFNHASTGSITRRQGHTSTGPVTRRQGHTPPGSITHQRTVDEERAIFVLFTTVETHRCEAEEIQSFIFLEPKTVDLVNVLTFYSFSRYCLHSLHSTIYVQPRAINRKNEAKLSFFFNSYAFVKARLFGGVCRCPRASSL